MTSIIQPDPVGSSAVAVIGAGPSGLASAAWLKKRGFAPTLFEAANRLGGQWNSASRASGVWRGMRTNTSRVLSAFSDLDHARDTPVYPSQADMLAYLERYAETQGITDAIRLSTNVERLARAAGGGFLLRSRCGGNAREQFFPRVVIASGRYNAPLIPDVDGLSGFSGAGGVIHSFHYNGAETFAGMDVLVAGCSISALEIASELAQMGARSVTVTYRRQRYILQKLSAGVPTEHVAFTRFAALAGSVLPLEALATGLKEFTLSTAGSPEQYGALTPDENILAAGLSLSQTFLPLVAEGRIRVRPWMESVRGCTISFADGAQQEFDAIVMGTGYGLSLPFLDAEIAEAIGLGAGGSLRLHHQTFHSDLDGLAFAGLFAQVGPYLPVLELQARWIAYAWSGTVPAPTVGEMRESMAWADAEAGGPSEFPMHALATLFATMAGVEPDLARWPELERALLFGPLSPASFRLQGPDALPDAPERTRMAAAAFGAIREARMTAEERAKWDTVRALLERSAA